MRSAIPADVVKSELKHEEQKGFLDLTWEGFDLPYVPRGDYLAVCVGWQGPMWVRAYRRWSLRLEFSLLDDGTLVSAFFNLGTDPSKPHIGRRSRYYRAWCLANGGAPMKGQRMMPETFVEPGLVYLVRVEVSTEDEKNEPKPAELTYSRVTDILKVQCP